MLYFSFQGRGGVQAYLFGKKDFELGVGGEGQDTTTRPDILRVVLGPYVQHCPCESFEQKLGQKPKSELQKIEPSYCHHSICPQKRAFKKRTSKLDGKLPSYPCGRNILTG